MSRVEKDKVVEIHYTVRLEDGSVADTTEGEPPIPYLHGSGSIVPGLERALEGHNAGDHVSVTLTPEDAYGPYDDELLQEIPFDALPEDVELAEGDELYLIDDEGVEVPGVIERIEQDAIIVNYNHPLAGETLTFEVQIADVRDATPEELEHGHAHDPYAEDDDEWDDEDEWEEWDDEDDEDDEEFEADEADS